MIKLPEHLEKELVKIYKGIQVAAIFCTQWGDSAKGMAVDILAFLVDVIARGTGGNNAGHTVKIGDLEYIFHLIPSGILQDSIGKYNLICRGTVIDPRVLVEEIEALKSEKLSYNNLRISNRANVITPQCIVLDKLEGYLKGKSRIGTTGRGIGPAYADYVSRNGIFIDDIFNTDIFANKIKERSNFLRALLSTVDREELKKVFNHKHLIGGAYYNKKKIFDDDAIIEQYQKFGNEFKELITNTEKFLKKSLNEGKKALLEGAQGTLLDLDHGTYPYVTSSNASLEGLIKGVGLKQRHIDIAYGIVKCPYITRVGNGPFPTEFGGIFDEDKSEFIKKYKENSEEYCDKGLEHDIFYEAVTYLGISSNHKAIKYRDEKELKKLIKSKSEIITKMVNLDDPFIKGVGIRIAGFEYGATTKRPRRTGRFGLFELEYASEVNDNYDIILTKMDVMDMAEKIELCIGHTYEGPDVFYEGKILKKGTKMTSFERYSLILYHCKPEYIEVPGWQTDTTGLRNYNDAPKEFKNLVEIIEKKTGARVWMISVGADREETIIRSAA